MKMPEQQRRIIVQELEMLAEKYRAYAALSYTSFHSDVSENFSALAKAIHEEKKSFEAVA